MSTVLSEYCGAVLSGKLHEVHTDYHDNEYGFPIIGDDDALFERLILEINQAGLSWETVLKKRDGFREAYAQFSIIAVADFGDDEIAQLLNNPEIIRNRLKVQAAIDNARTILSLQKEFGSFENWLILQSEQLKIDKVAWVKLFKKTFKFTGGEITGEFLMSLGYLPGAHVEGCPVLEQIAEHRPCWMMF